MNDYLNYFLEPDSTNEEDIKSLIKNGVSIDDFLKSDKENINNITIDNEFANELNDYNKTSTINKENYRELFDKLYEDIKYVKPLDKVGNIVYYDDYNELGLSINSSDANLKQIWTDYRLIYNEKENKEVVDETKDTNNEDIKIKENSFVLDNFDDLYNNLSKKVDGVDKYINDLIDIKHEIDFDNGKIENEKVKLEQEKIAFENYKNEQKALLEEKEKELNTKLAKVNDLMKKLDEKVNTFINT